MTDNPVPLPEPTPPTSPPAKPKKKSVGCFTAGIVILLATLSVIVGLALAEPTDYVVGRSEAMKAPKKAVFDLVNDFHNWDSWSPWAKLDPNMKTTFSGPPSGVGAEYSWEGNSDVGRGKMTITDSKPNESITIRLEFYEPFPSVCETVFSFRQERDNALIGWRMSGKHNFFSKLFMVFTSMDAMIGPDFEKGLKNLKTKVETDPQ